MAFYNTINPFLMTAISNMPQGNFFDRAMALVNNNRVGTTPASFINLQTLGSISSFSALRSNQNDGQ